MTPQPRPLRGTMLRRALGRRCPWCGTPSFESFYELEEVCPGCRLMFERESGYWVGALIINTTATFALFVSIFVGGAVATWPDVPWGALMAVTVGVNLIFPILFYPYSKSLWSALELSWHPPEDHEFANHLGSGRPG